MIALLKRLYGFRQGRVSARKYAREQQRLIDRLSGLAARSLSRDINREVRRVGALIQANNEPSRTQIRNSLNESLGATLTKHYQRCFKTVYDGNRDKYEQVIQKQVDVGAGFDFSRNKDLDEEIAAFVFYRRQNLITNVADNVALKIIRETNKLRLAGLGNDQIGRELRDVFGFLSRRRADVIARTETHAAVSAAQDSYHNRMTARYGLQVKKRWLATGDARTRSAHAIMNGKEVAMDDKFVMPNGTRMKHVGDPAGGPSNTINCRCVILYVDVEDEVQDADIPAVAADEPPEIDLSDVVKSGNKISAAEYQQALKENAGDLTYETMRRVPKPTVIESGSGVYYDRTGRLVATLSTKGGSTLVHEYGHHVDAMISKQMIKAGKVKASLNTAMFSQYDKKFIEAFDADRIANGLVKSIGARRIARADRVKRDKVIDEIKEDLTTTERIESKVRPGFFHERIKLKDESVGGLMDIVDAATKGYAYNSRGFFGHGVTYYRRKNRPEMYETFANCFQSYGTPAWPKVKKYFPRTAARFEEILEEFNRTGDIDFDEYGP